ncbi:MAG TPA: hypothetical protein VM686_04275, partial [Polyangiaceae bacterium]|nr:hypothetical protein [Polyangiaceae bacterium]
DQAQQLELAVLLAHGGRTEPLVELTSTLEASENQLNLAPIAARGALSLAPLQAYALAMLARRTPYGEARSEGVMVKLETPHGSRSAHRTQLSVPAGTKMKLRLCDLYAFELSSRHDTPEFMLFQPVAERDRMIAKVADWLREQKPND